MSEQKQKNTFKVQFTDEQLAELTQQTGLPKDQLVGIARKYQFDTPEKIIGFLAYEKKVSRLSHRQLLGELRRVDRIPGKQKTYHPGLNVALATVLTAVLENTKTRQNPNGRLHSYPR